MESVARAGGDPISPELALVDPALAEIERTRLLEAPQLRLGRQPTWPSESRVIATDWRAVTPQDALDGSERTSGGRPWTLLVVGAVTVLSLLFLDLRVEIGGSPAPAERLSKPSVPTQAARPPVTSTGRRPVSVPPQRTVRRLAWAPVEGASSYHVELFRGARRIFSANSAEPSLVVPPTWRYGGAEHRLEPGDYQWYVWPVVAGARATNATVQTRLTISSS